MSRLPWRSRSLSKSSVSSGPVASPRLRGASPTPEQLASLIQTCGAFSLAIRSQVEQETKAWLVEFQNNLSQLEKDLQTKGDEAKAKAKPAGAARVRGAGLDDRSLTVDGSDLGFRVIVPESMVLPVRLMAWK